MSSMERNKGFLHYVAPVDEFRECVGSMDDLDFSDYLTDLKLMQVGDVIYRPEYDVESETDEFSFSEVSTFGTLGVSFHTMHYNGGGSLSEVIESALKKLEKPPQIVNKDF